MPLYCQFTISSYTFQIKGVGTKLNTEEAQYWIEALNVINDRLHAAFSIFTDGQLAKLHDNTYSHLLKAICDYECQRYFAHHHNCSPFKIKIKGVV